MSHRWRVRLRVITLNLLPALLLAACSFAPELDPLNERIEGSNFLIEHLGEQWQGERTHSVSIGSEKRDVFVIINNGRDETRREPSLQVSPTAVVPSRAESESTDDGSLRHNSFDSAPGVASIHEAIPRGSELPSFDSGGTGGADGAGGGDSAGDASSAGGTDGPGGARDSLSDSTGESDNSPLRASSTGGSRTQTVGESTETFYAITDGSLERLPTPATLRAQATGGNGLRVSIWVQDSQWTSEETTTESEITEDMVDAMAEVFFEDTSGTPGVFEATRALFGDYWGPHDHSALIGETETVDILLLDIAGAGSPNDPDRAPGLTVGYFDPRDLYKESVIEGSAERAMVYLHAPAFATAQDNDWHPADRWPSEMLLTMAHEFQHLINFYESTVLRGVRSEVWLDELMSLQTEELVASLIVEHSVFDGGSTDGQDRNEILRGSRGLPAQTARGDDPPDLYGQRVSTYNEHTDRSLTNWDGGDIQYSNVLADYAISYAFGAWLVRNFDDGSLMQGITDNTSGGRDAITGAVRSSSIGGNYGFVQLMDMWMSAVVLSDLNSSTADLPRGYRLTRGGAGDDIRTAAFRIESDAGTLRLGSVDTWFYANSESATDGPGTETPDSSGRWKASHPMAPVSSKLVKVADGVTDTTVEITFDPPPGVSITVVTRDPP